MKLGELYDKAFNLISIESEKTPVFVDLQNGCHAEVIDIIDTGIIISLQLEKMDKAQISSHTDHRCTKCNQVFHIAHMSFVNSKLMCFHCKAKEDDDDSGISKHNL